MDHNMGHQDQGDSKCVNAVSRESHILCISVSNIVQEILLDTPESDIRRGKYFAVYNKELHYLTVKNRLEDKLLVS